LAMRAAMYARVSAANNGQDLTMQTRVDTGISGAKDRIRTLL
jgi:predicted site-specific integrase-resolvase